MSALDLVRLRELLAPVVMGLAYHTHKELDGACARLGLPKPPGETEGMKAERVSQSFAELSDADLPTVAERILAGQLAVDALTRNQLQDALWAGQGGFEISKRTRREIAQDVSLADLVYDSDRFMTLLDSLWVLDDDPSSWFTDSTTSLRARIERHAFRFPDDWSTEYLFEQLGAFEASDGRISRFLEGLVSADVIPDEPRQRRLVGIINPQLEAIGIELRETGLDSGYPKFSLVRIQAARNQRPKNLIFATLAKPDIRFRDAINNDIEIVDNADKVLVYDRPIGSDGLRWRDLQAWWMDKEQTTDEAAAKKSLYDRLGRSLPPNSPRNTTSSSFITRSTPARCPTSQPSCPRSGCTGIPRPSAIAAPKRCSVSAWTFCSCCAMASAWS